MTILKKYRESIIGAVAAILLLLFVTLFICRELYKLYSVENIYGSLLLAYPLFLPIILGILCKKILAAVVGMIFLVAFVFVFFGYFGGVASGGASFIQIPFIFFGSNNNWFRRFGWIAIIQE